MLWSRRSVFLGLLVGGPVVLAVAVRLVFACLRGCSQRQPRARPGDAVFGVMMWLLYVRFIVPVLGVFYGTPSSPTRWTTGRSRTSSPRPIPRRACSFGKYLAYLVCSALLVLPSAMLVFFLIVPTGGGSIGAGVSRAASGPGHAGHRSGGIRSASSPSSAHGSGGRFSLAWCSPSAGSRRCSSFPGI